MKTEILRFVFDILAAIGAGHCAAKLFDFCVIIGQWIRERMKP